MSVETTPRPQPKEPHGAGIECPECGCVDNSVYKTKRLLLTINGRKTGIVRRTRLCDFCENRWVTTER